VAPIVRGSLIERLECALHIVWLILWCFGDLTWVPFSCGAVAFRLYDSNGDG